MTDQQTSPQADSTPSAAATAEKRTPQTPPEQRTGGDATNPSQQNTGPLAVAVDATPQSPARSDDDVALVVTFASVALGLPRHAALQRVGGLDEAVFTHLRNAALKWLPGEQQRRAALGDDITQVRRRARDIVAAARRAIPQKPIPQKPPVGPLAHQPKKE